MAKKRLSPLPKPKESEVEAYGFIRQQLRDLGWIVRDPSTTPLYNNSGNVNRKANLGTNHVQVGRVQIAYPKIVSNPGSDSQVTSLGESPVFVGFTQQRIDQVDGQRKDNGRVLVRGDRGQGFKVAQLQRGGSTR